MKETYIKTFINDRMDGIMKLLNDKTDKEDIV